MFAKALDETIDHFKLSATEISKRTGITQATISTMRSGKTDPKLSTFEAIIDALPPEARRYMFFEKFLLDLQDGDVPMLLNAIAARVTSDSRYTAGSHRI